MVLLEALFLSFNPILIQSQLRYPVWYTISIDLELWPFDPDTTEGAVEATDFFDEEVDSVAGSLPGICLPYGPFCYVNLWSVDLQDFVLALICNSVCV